MYQVSEQYLDTESGFHIVRLKDGKKEHLVQIAVGADACPACGHATPKNNLAELDPKAMVQAVLDDLNKSQADMLEYANKHGIKPK